MKRRQGLLFGPLAAIFLAAGIAGLPLIVPGYNSVYQTVSEIGEVGSPAHVPFALDLYAVAGCMLIFAWALGAVARDAGRSSLPAWFVGCMTVTVAALGWFAYPHPLHSVIGPTELIGYQAPLAIALTWRKEPTLRPVAMFSAWIAILLWLAIIANLCVLDPHGPILGVVWAFERPFYGLVQRTLFLFWCIWCAGTGLWLWVHTDVSVNCRSVIVKEAAKRSIFRWVHIICGVPILGYIYDSPSDTPYYAHSIRFIFLPVLVSSGLWMWKGHVLRRLSSRTFAMNRRRAVEAPNTHQSSIGKHR